MAVAGQNRNCWIIHSILVKVDAETRRKWIEASRGLDTPTIDDLLKLLERRCEEFDLNKREADTDVNVGPRQNNTKQTSHALVSLEKGSCVKNN